MSEPQKQVIVVEHQSNGLGTAGFVISLIGFLVCGLIGPLGLLLSFLGLFSRPRGLAIAGVILGGLQSAFLALGGFALIAGILGIGGAFSRAHDASLHLKASQAIEKHFETYGSLPSQVEGQALVDEELRESDLVRYEKGSDEDFRTITRGPDAEFGTEDDYSWEHDVRDTWTEPAIEEPAIEEPAIEDPASTEQPAEIELGEPEPVRSDDPAETPQPTPMTVPQANIIGESVPAEMPEDPEPAPKPLRFTDQESRSWKSEDGKFEIEATLTGFDPANQTAALQKPDGKYITVELKKLSLKDRNHIRNAAKNDGS